MKKGKWFALKSLIQSLTDRSSLSIYAHSNFPCSLTSRNGKNAGVRFGYRPNNGDMYDLFIEASPDPAWAGLAVNKRISEEGGFEIIPAKIVKDVLRKEDIVSWADLGVDWLDGMVSVSIVKCFMVYTFVDNVWISSAAHSLFDPNLPAALPTEDNLAWAQAIDALPEFDKGRVLHACPEVLQLRPAHVDVYDWWGNRTAYRFHQGEESLFLEADSAVAG